MLLLACGVVLHAGLAAALFGWRRLVPEILVAQESEAPS
jgi:hypothetical protein